jgi:hypothetical protein
MVFLGGLDDRIGNPVSKFNCQRGHGAVYIKLVSTPISAFRPDAAFD